MLFQRLPKLLQLFNVGPLGFPAHFARDSALIVTRWFHLPVSLAFMLLSRSRCGWLCGPFYRQHQVIIHLFVT
jgi:hypothetical protein